MAASTGDISTTLPTRTSLATTLSTTTSGMLALTTTFYPPISCLTEFWDVYYTEDPDYSCSKSTYTSTCEYLRLGPQWPLGPECFPTNYFPNTTSPTFFSPGICPFGYMEGCATTVSVEALTETRAVCCPSSYECQNQTDRPWYGTNQCVSRFKATSEVVLTTFDLSDKTTYSFTSSLTDDVNFNAYGISIRYQSIDFVSTTAAITLSSATSPSNISQSFAPSNTTIPTPGTKQSSSLSSSAGAGIGVGVTIGVFALVGCGLFYFWHRRRSTSATYEVAPVRQTPPSESYDRSELAGSQIYQAHELDYVSRQEDVTSAQHTRQSDAVELASSKE